MLWRWKFILNQCWCVCYVIIAIDLLRFIIIYHHCFKKCFPSPTYVITTPDVIRVDTNMTVGVTLMDVDGVAIQLSLQQYPNRQTTYSTANFTASSGTGLHFIQLSEDISCNVQWFWWLTYWINSLANYIAIHFNSQVYGNIVFQRLQLKNHLTLMWNIL